MQQWQEMREARAHAGSSWGLNGGLVLCCLSSLLGCHSEHDQPVTATGSGGTTGNGYFCENLVMTPGADCFRAGLSCPTSDYLARYLCQRDGTWALQVFGIPDAGVGSAVSAGNGDAGAADAGHGRFYGASTPCGQHTPGECVTDVLCEELCCSVGAAAGSNLCGSCCVQRPCESFDASACPLDYCELVGACGGGLACVDRRLDQQPCGLPGHQAGRTGCCSGTVPRCGVLQSTGECSSVFSYPKPPTCMACGDGTCENGPVSVENACSCPEDCAGAGSN